MKVYVITAGEYSDYHIVGVTTDKSKAKKVEKIHDVYIEEFDTDEFLFDIDTIDKILSQGNNCYKVHYDEKYYALFGTTFKVEPINGYDFDSYNKKVQKCIDGEVETYSNYFNDNDTHSYNFYIIAKDEHHALKIAQDKYAKIKAERLGL